MVNWSKLSLILGKNAGYESSSECILQGRVPEGMKLAIITCNIILTLLVINNEDTDDRAVRQMLTLYRREPN